MSNEILYIGIFTLALLCVFLLPSKDHDPVQERIDFMNSRKDGS